MKFIIILLLSLKIYSQNNVMKFIYVKDIPVVELNVNGENAYFLVDSGASYSMIHSLDCDYFKFKIRASTYKIKGINSKTLKLRNTSKINISYKNIILNIKFKSVDLTGLKNNLNIIGVLGSDWLRKNEVIIDYKRNILWLKR